MPLYSAHKDIYTHMYDICTPRTLEPCFYNLHQIQWYLVCFEILYQLPNFYPQRHPRALKLVIRYILIITFKTKGLDLKVSLVRAHQIIKLCLKGNLLSVIPRIQESVFRINVWFHDFFMVFSLFWNIVINFQTLPTGEPIRGARAVYINNF